MPFSYARPTPSPKHADAAEAAPVA
jgi:hypothetical protein